jgi:ribosomal protein S18 acetylase RimI-like enzyme
MTGTNQAPLSGVELVDLEGEAREAAVPILIDSFVGIYRWHAKRTLRRVSSVRGARVGTELRAVAMLERLVPEVGYVYYIAVAAVHRREGLGRRLLDDALERFRAEGMRIVYAAAEEDNAASIALFQSRGFRPVERDEPGYLEGGLGARGLRTRMMLVSGEVLLGRVLSPSLDHPSGVSRPPANP